MAKIPDKIRSTLDETYKEIKKESARRKKKQYVQRTIASAAAVIVMGVVIMNDDVQASFSQLFQGDRGVNKAISEGYVQKDGGSIRDQGIEVTLSEHFYDDRKLGMKVVLDFDDPDQLNEVDSVSMDYRLKNGDGTYLIEMIPDTKPLKGDGNIYFSAGDEQAFMNVNEGVVAFESLHENTNKEKLPEIHDAALEIERIKLWNDNEFESVDGEWNISMNDMKKRNDIKPIHYVAMEAAPIKIIEATANPTSLNLEFEVEGDYRKREHDLTAMVIVDSEGNEYSTNLYNHSSGDNYKTTTVTTTFQISSYDNMSSLTFSIGEIGEVKLSKAE